MMTEIFIEGNRLDISADISSLLTFAIDDVKDFSARQTTFSKTIVLPGTANNNQLFGGIFETGIANNYVSGMNNVGYNFNAAKSARCVIFQDSLQTFKGTMRLLEIVKDRGLIEYEVAVNGELTSLSVSLSTGYLDSLDFSAYDRSYDVATIIASWDNVPGAGIYFPLIDYGTYSTNKHDWDFRTFRPALYVKEYLDKIFADANFRYICALFDTDRFKRLVVPHNTKTFQHTSTGVLSTSRSNSAHVIDQATLFTVPIQMTTFISTIFTPSLSNSRFTYTPAAAQLLHFTFSSSGQMRRVTTTFEMYVRLNGVEVVGSRTTYAANGNSTPNFYSYNFAFDYAINQNDYIELVAESGPIFNTDFMTANPSGAGAVSPVPVLVPVGLGDSFQINESIPKNIKRIDFLVSIVKMFNLYVYEDRFDERTIHISPFVDFYSAGSGNAIDWTYKLNRDSPVRIKPLSEINSKIYKFNYKDDTDYYNDQYKKRYNQSYGSYVFDSEFEFASNENKLEVIFASTPLVGYTGEDKVYPTIFKKSGTVEESIDSVIRIMQTKKITGVTSWDIKDGATVLTSLTDYGYAGHFDDPDSPDNDLNFGVLNELFFILLTGDLTKTQFNLYWSSYMAEITDKDSKMLIGKFYLTAKDIFELDFSKYIYLDGSLFRLNKITDYNTTTPSDCEVQLLKVIQTSYSFPPTIPTDNGAMLYYFDGVDEFAIDWSFGETMLYK